MKSIPFFLFGGSLAQLVQQVIHVEAVPGCSERIWRWLHPRFVVPWQVPIMPTNQTHAKPTNSQSAKIAKQPRIGLTRVELLVVMAILVLAVSLVVVGVQAVRAAHSRMQCANNLRHISHACLAAEDALGSMPPYG
jgi:hypothetical protein